MELEKLKNEYNKNLYRFKRYMQFKQTPEYKAKEEFYEEESSKILDRIDCILVELEKLGQEITQEIIEEGFEVEGNSR